MEASALKGTQPLPEDARTPEADRKGEIILKYLGFCLVSSSILLQMNLVQTAGEPGKCSLHGKMHDEVELRANRP